MGGSFALLATKRYYFGLGGGTLELQRLAEGREGEGEGEGEGARRLRVRVVASIEDGSSNVRDILRVEWA